MINSLIHSIAFGLQGPELIILLVLVLLFFGGAKIPQLMRGLGKGMGEFQQGIKEGKRNFDAGMNPDDDTTEPAAKA